VAAGLSWQQIAWAPVVSIRSGLSSRIISNFGYAGHLRL
jgi:hypothetical protein